MNVFDTPVVTFLLRQLSRLLLWIKRWKVEGKPPPLDRCVLICAPHSSNWDFPYMMSVAFSRRMKVQWMGKHTLFPPVIGAISRWFGGIAVNRHAAMDIVDQMVSEFAKRPQLTLLITPEGTRSEVNAWKTGFYRIAMQAGVPILPAYIDYPSKTMGFGEPFYPTGNLADDIHQLQQFYTGRRRRNDTICS